MTINIIRADIICHKCESGIAVPSFMKMTEIRRWASKQGWDVATSSDYCPSCAYQMQKSKPARSENEVG